ncbi:hypothetical protein FD754_014689 [Muntiacus muntjak]|uniref:Plectin/eS10 N-terminal domain-containing protein n=1 Tax=Muntiacus muntjak TaxID=9888 RepID=A0A5N3VKX0_MUNMU|nr:hypothetical protein FD754_014689 [Muntiacus muntjak]
MLMPKKNRIDIYELLYKAGVMHLELSDKNVPNLHVTKAMQSLKSRGYVKEQFAWRHFYWHLTNKAILRLAGHGPKDWRESDLQGSHEGKLTNTYRRNALPPGADKKAEAGAGSATEFQFRGGFGHGHGQPPQ